MAAVTAAVVGTAVALKGQRDSKKSQKKAAKESEEAAIKSAEILKTATRAGEQDVLEAQQQAAVRSALGATEAAGRIQPFADIAAPAFTTARDSILSGQPLTGPIADSIRSASLAGINRRAFDTQGIQPELQRQAGLSVSGVTPSFNNALLAAGQQGISAAGDIGGIRSRGLESLADIAGAAGTQRASLLVGASPALQTLSQGATEARLLGDIAGQRARTSQVESLAKLAGRVL